MMNGNGFMCASFTWLFSNGGRNGRLFVSLLQKVYNIQYKYTCSTTVYITCNYFYCGLNFVIITIRRPHFLINLFVNIFDYLVLEVTEIKYIS